VRVWTDGDRLYAPWPPGPGIRVADDNVSPPDWLAIALGLGLIAFLLGAVVAYGRRAFGGRK
jgi:hypothetical protein